LIRRLVRAEIARQKAQVFKPALDNRYTMDKVSSHGGGFHQAVAVENSAEIARLVEDDTNIVAIDEVQFFDWTIAPLCERFANEGRRIILAGLDLDFRGEPFGPVPLLMAQAEMVDKLHAICMVCGAPASRTQRLLNGCPADYNDPVIMVGASEVYEARCRRHHEVPQKQ
jgi:thymidine kinase